MGGEEIKRKLGRNENITENEEKQGKKIMIKNKYNKFLNTALIPCIPYMPKNTFRQK